MCELLQSIDVSCSCGAKCGEGLQRSLLDLRMGIAQSQRRERGNRGTWLGAKSRKPANR